jgi:hypothetical protein
MAKAPTPRTEGQKATTPKRKGKSPTDGTSNQAAENTTLPPAVEASETGDGQGKSAAGAEQATIVYPGTIKGRATIELRVFPDGHNEAYLVPTAAAPIPTGVSLSERKGKYFLTCRIRKKRLSFKPEEVVRQKILNYLIDELL